METPTVEAPTVEAPTAYEQSSVPCRPGHIGTGNAYGVVSLLSGCCLLLTTGVGPTNSWFLPWNPLSGTGVQVYGRKLVNTFDIICFHKLHMHTKRVHFNAMECIILFDVPLFFSPRHLRQG